jgi:hypothetical protein
MRILIRLRLRSIHIYCFSHICWWEQLINIIYMLGIFNLIFGYFILGLLWSRRSVTAAFTIHQTFSGFRCIQLIKWVRSIRLSRQFIRFFCKCSVLYFNTCMLGWPSLLAYFNCLRHINCSLFCKITMLRWCACHYWTCKICLWSLKRYVRLGL